MNTETTTSKATAMRKITLKAISLMNFKGIRDLKIDFGGRDTDISGANGLGKSTVFDAFTWLLFGKDHRDRKQFGIKTRDEQGAIMPRLPHEVEATLSVDGRDITLTRRFREKWVKRRGSAEEEFTGNEEERLWDGVPCSLRDWNDKVAAVCPEQVFKFITSPLHFTAQKPEVQREMLMRMAGGVSDEQIAATNPGFAALLADMTGKTMEEYRRETAAAKRRIRAEIDEIPGRIDERKRDNATEDTEDWDALAKEYDTLKARRAEVEKQTASAVEAQKAHAARLAEMMQRVTAKETEAAQRAAKVAADTLADTERQRSRRSQLLARHSTAAGARAYREQELKGLEAEVQRCDEQRGTLIAEYRQLMATARGITHEIECGSPEMQTSDYVCPTCGHPYDAERILEVQQKALDNYREERHEKLRRNAEKIAENKRRGLENNSRKQQLEERIGETKGQIAALAAETAEIEADPLYSAEPAAPDTAPAIEADAQHTRLTQEAAELRRQYDALAGEMPTAADPKLAEEAADLAARIEQTAVRLSRREDIAANGERIAQLQRQLTAANQTLADLEKREFTIRAFQRARTDAMQQKINALFAAVKFRMTDTQVNGEEVETCEATMDGVPFSDLNDAARINAGLDIINAICRTEGISAPIFIDNAESVNRLTPTLSQRIRLTVSSDTALTVTHPDPSLL